MYKRKQKGRADIFYFMKHAATLPKDVPIPGIPLAGNIPLAFLLDEINMNIEDKIFDNLLWGVRNNGAEADIDPSRILPVFKTW